MPHRQWPSSFDEVRRVARHWVTSCGADVLSALAEIEFGLDMAYDNGFWTGRGLPHAVPVGHVPHEQVRRVEPEALVDLGMFLALHDRRHFASACDLISRNVGRGGLWPLLHKEIQEHTHMPPLMHDVFFAIKHPATRTFVWKTFLHISSTYAADAVEQEIVATMAEPLPICSVPEHECVRELVTMGGIVLSNNHKKLGVLQYTGIAIGMSRIDHYLLVLMAVYSTTTNPLPRPLAALRAKLAERRAHHTKTNAQRIKELWNLGHTLP